MPEQHKRTGCDLCKSRGKTKFDLPIRMAFHPIIDVEAGQVFAHEALVRGPEGQSAGSVLGRVDDGNRYNFDQLCRTTAIETASEIGMTTALSINFMPNAVYEPANCIQATLRAAERTGFDLERIIFEFTENEDLTSSDKLNEIVQEYARHGLRTAIDDFGAGYSGLNRLAQLQPDYVKLDMDLTRNLDQDARRRTLVWHTKQMCDDLGIKVIAEGIETLPELAAVRDTGISLIQGYVFSEPRLEECFRDSEILKAFLTGPARMSQDIQAGPTLRASA
ncbi:MAG: EAL domain-containing protein [Alphaproteobacteria bacterium]|uniref:EAL domain-containing protein n=1 Tax=Maricaulis alexandrii TaxID=2570354 RepID=UPI0011093A32|nr:EAL domain-containing protein [Maricaulis alexandrii]MCR9266519.1 EAL domain-containing protein [Alphaproteobacteria bacterium]